MEQILKLLEQNNNEKELFERLLQQVLGDGNGDPKVTAARIQAGRDLRFDLKKVMEENDYPGLRSKGAGSK